MESNFKPSGLTIRRTLCLNMIVKNEAQVIRRCLDSVRPFIDHWVIVDTGSSDGTQDIIRAHFADIPGELHERPWRDFGFNRTQALELARGKADYILIMDADNIFRTPEGWCWPRLNGDAYNVQLHSNGTTYLQNLLVADRLPWRWVGVLHEYLTTDAPHRVETLAGAWIDRRHEGARSRDPETFRKDAAILERALTDDPQNVRYAFYLAQSWRDAGELNKARDAYRKRSTMGGWEEEVWYSLYEVANLSVRLDAPATDVRNDYLEAYQYRPRRAEPLVALAAWHRGRNEWALALMFARAARVITRPQDLLFLDDGAYRWRADDEAAIAAYWTGNLTECYALCWSLLDEDRVPEAERARIEMNRDFCVPTIAEQTHVYPAQGIRHVADRVRAGTPGRGVTLTITSCKRLALFERTVNSFINCCRDIDAVDRFVCIDDNSSDADRARMKEIYPFIEFIFKNEDDKGHARSMNILLEAVTTPWWLHLEDDWHFFVTADYVTRAISILDTEPTLAQVLFNRNYAEKLEDRTFVGGTLRRHSSSGLRYVAHEFLPEAQAREAFFKRFAPGSLSNVWWPHFSLRPSLMRVAAIRGLGRFDESPAHFEQEFALRYVAAGLQSAFFDAITCLHTGRLTTERESGKANAYELNQAPQF